MCGISGIISNSLDKDKIFKSINHIVSNLNHRGPDNQGILKISDNFYFGHNRLSILDLSSNGNQPMQSYNHNLIITYNGEIYNHYKIRKELNDIQKIIWKSECDTETLINSIEIIGLKKTLEIIDGMFAFAYFDKKKNKIFIVRDRFGEKPVYYYNHQGTFSFSSEIHGLTKIENFNKIVSEKSVYSFLNLSYIPSPYTIYQNTFKLEPGCILELDIDNFKKKKNFLKIEKWFEIENVIIQKKNNLFSNLETCSKNIEEKISKSIKSQMISDVGIGSFLSGGVDSSLVSTLMQKNSIKKIDTFSAKFENPDYDEADYAKKIANIIGSNHHELYISNQEVADNFEKTVDIFGEPFGDSSQVPTFLLSKFTSEQVKVCLSGDGGDELFGGYNRYKYTNLVWKLFKFLNLKNDLSKKILKKIPESFIIAILKIFKKNKISQIEDKVSKLYSVLFNIESEDDIYYELICSLKSQKHFKINNNLKFLDTSEKMMVLDLKNYLTDDILCKVDRCAMQNSLETRIPLLSKEVFNASWEVPVNFKFKNNDTKFILKNILEKYLPRNLVYRKKMGFGIPLKDVLIKNLNNRLPDSLKKIQRQNYEFLNEVKLQEIMNDKFVSAKNNNLKWNILIFAEWLNKRH